MAVDDLLRALEREADAEAEALRAAARADADEIVRAADRRVTARTAAALATLRARKQAEADAEVAALARRRRADVLVRRAAALERVRTAVDARLPELLTGAAGDELVGVLIDGVAAALASAATDGHTAEAVDLRCPPALVGQVRRRLGDRPGLAITGDAAIGPGLVAVRAAGQVTIDARLTTLLGRWWPHLRLAVNPQVPS